MRGNTIARLVGAGLGAAALALGLGGVAGASNLHIHGTIPTGIGTVTFSTGVPPGCTALTTTSLIVPLSGNAVTHFNFNSTGAWFTTTLTGTAELVTGTAVIATGRVTEWDGGSLNQLFTPGKTTIVSDFTAHFVGWTTTGSRVSIHANAGSTTLDATVTLTGTTLTIVTPGITTRTHFRASCS